MSKLMELLFKVLKKRKNKFDCLIYVMLFIRDIKPKLMTPYAQDVLFDFDLSLSFLVSFLNFF